MNRRRITYLLAFVLVLLPLLYMGRHLPGFLADTTGRFMTRTVEKQHHKAMLYAQQDKYEEALKLFDVVLEKTDNNPDYLCDYIHTLTRAGKYEQALAASRHLPPSYTPSDQVLIDLGACYRKTGQYKEAVSFCGDFAVTDSRNRQSIEDIVYSYVRANRYDEAVELIEKETTSHQQPWLQQLNYDVRHEQAVFLARQGDYERAFEIIQQIQNKTKNREEILEDYVAILSWAGQHHQAVKIFESLPEEGYEKPEYVLLAAAESYRNLKKTDTALALYKQRLERHPQDLSLVRKIIQLFQESGRFESAEQFIREETKKAPHNKEILTYYLAGTVRQQAIAQGEQKNYAAAVDLVEKAWRMSGKNPDILGDYIVLMSWSGRHKEALELAANFPEQYPLPDYVLIEMIRSCRGVVDFEKGIDIYENLVKITLLNNPRLNQLINLDIKAGLLDEAVGFIAAQVIGETVSEKELAPFLTAIKRRQAVLLGQAGDSKSALKIIANVLPEGENDPEILWDYIVLLSWEGRHAQAVTVFESLSNKNNLPEYLLTEVARSYKETGHDGQAETYFRVCLKSNPRQEKAIKGLLSLLIAKKRFSEIDALIADLNKTDNQAGILAERCLGDIYFETGNLAGSEAIYRRRLEADPDHSESQAGLCRIWIHKGEYEQARGIIRDLLEKNPADLEALFCKAELAQADRDQLEAYKIYSYIQEFDPDNQRAVDAKYTALLDMAATSLVRDKLSQNREGLGEEASQLLRNKETRDRMEWQEMTSAIDLFQKNFEFLRSDENLGGYPDDYLPPPLLHETYDRLFTAAQQQNMEKCLQEYQRLKEMNVDIPSWVIETAAGASLYLRQPETALDLYRQAHEKKKEEGRDQYPDNFNINMAIYKTLIDLERFDEADDILDRLENEVPAYRIQRGVWLKNWHKIRVSVERAWWLITQNRFAEAQNYLAAIQKSAPFNTDIRGALAHVYLYRGWPRRALEEFNIILGLSPDSITSWVGYAEALNENDEGKTAREIIRTLHRKFPKDQSVQKTLRNFELQDMRQLTIAANFSSGDTFLDEGQMSIKLVQPIYSWRSIFAETVWKYAEDEDKEKTIKRNYLGYDWRLSPKLWIDGAFSLDYHGETTGVTGGLTFKPDDHLQFSASGETYSMTLPPKALLYDVEGSATAFMAAYRHSEDINVIGGVRIIELSDDNRNVHWSMKLDKSMTSSAIWKTRVALEGNLVTNTLEDTAYYSPEQAAAVYLVPMFEHLWFKNYKSSLHDRLYTGLGFKKEEDYSLADIWFTRYEHDYHLSDTLKLLMGASYAKNTFDGEEDFSWGLNASLNYHF